MQRLETKPRHRGFTKCFFDPKRACGSYTRSKLAYQRAELIKEATACGIPGAMHLSIDALCQLLRTIHFESAKLKEFVDRFKDFDVLKIDSYLPYPPLRLTIPKALSLLKNERILQDLKVFLQENIKTIIDGPFERQRAFLMMSHVFFPDLYEKYKTIANLSKEDQENVMQFLEDLEKEK